MNVQPPETGVVLVGPYPPPYGGMALQGRLLERCLRGDGVPVSFCASNFDLPRPFRAFAGVPGLRTLLRAVWIWPRLWRAVRPAGVVHVLAASWVYFFAVVYPAVIVGRLCGKRVVVNYRGGEAREFFSSYGWLAGPVFRLANVVTAPSPFLAEVLGERFGVNVAIVPNILDTSMFPSREREEFHPRCLVTRHLEPIYDVESVIRAFRLIHASHPDATLLIAGSGNEESRLRQLVECWGLSGVTFLGHVPQSELPKLYSRCDIYLNASRVDNFPGALLEASACGLLVATTAAGGIPHIYRHEDTALLVPPGNWEGLANAVNNVLQSQSKAITMTKRATAMIKRCEWTSVRGPLFTAYGFEPFTVMARRDAGGTPCAAG